MNERSGLKAHSTLAPANVRYASRQMMCGGKIRRERFCATKATEIAAMAGQKIRVAGLTSNECGGTPKTLRKPINGDTIKAKTHAEIGRIANLSIIALV